jgi:hypothetical protein
MKAYVLSVRSPYTSLASRIFSFANSPELFATTCARLFALMIDTVPKGVKLTEVIEPLPAKPQGAQITVLANGTSALRGEVRVSILFLKCSLLLISHALFHWT